MKGTDQHCSYCTINLHLCLRICKKLVFSLCLSIGTCRRANEVLATETQMFEKFHKRVEPKDLAGIGVAGAGVTPSQSTQTLTHSVTRKKSKARSSAVDKSLRLNAEQKCDIAQREIEELREEIDHLKDDSEKVLDTYKVGSDCCISPNNPSGLSHSYQLSFVLRKPVFGVSDQVRHKPGFTATEDG